MKGKRLTGKDIAFGLAVAIVAMICLLGLFKTLRLELYSAHQSAAVQAR